MPSSRVSDEEIADYSFRFLELLSKENSTENIFHQMCEEWFQITDCHSGAIILINPQTEYLEVRNFKGLSWQMCKKFRRKIDTGYLGELFWQGKQIVLNSQKSNPAMWDELVLEGDPKSILAVAIESQGQTLGYFYSAYKKEGEIDESLLNLAAITANIAGEVFIRNFLIHQLRLLEKHDKDIGVMHYHVFYDHLVEEVNKLERYDKEMSLAIFDVDNFKSINNTYGKEISIILLKELTAFFNQHIRNVDLLGRFGVDEFIMALSQTSLGDAEVFIQRLYEKIKKKKFTAEKLNITLSAGIVNFPSHSRKASDLIRIAKYALFEAQRKGKNNFYIPEKDEMS